MTPGKGWLVFYPIGEDKPGNPGFVQKENIFMVHVPVMLVYEGCNIYGWSTTPLTYPPQKQGLLKGLLTIGFRQFGLIKPIFLGGHVEGG